MTKFNLKILFPKSRSKAFKSVLKIASVFEDFTSDEIYTLTISDEKELMEKWEYFTLVFWKVIDWKGSAVEFEGQRYQSHTDKTRIFYSLQDDHNTDLNMACERIKYVRQFFNCNPTYLKHNEIILN